MMPTLLLSNSILRISSAVALCGLKSGGLPASNARRAISTPVATSLDPPALIPFGPSASAIVPCGGASHRCDVAARPLRQYLRWDYSVLLGTIGSYVILAFIRMISVSRRERFVKPSSVNDPRRADMRGEV